MMKDSFRIAWIVPYVSPGSGGMQTICRHLTYLQRQGAECHVLVLQRRDPLSPEQIAGVLADSYDCRPDAVFSEPFSDKRYDVAIATFNQTVPYLQFLRCDWQCYFAQDYEPWFYPMGEQHLYAAESYALGIPIITIGRWLADKLERESGAKVLHTDFSVDRRLYFDSGSPRIESVCAVFQPEKPRRCSALLCRSLELLHELRPDVEIYTFGSAQGPRTDAPLLHLGVLSKGECNALYGQCKVGVCISSSNPSRVPFEMMAAGLPVVDVFRENTLFDYPDAVSLAMPNEPAIAHAVIRLLDDEELWARSSCQGRLSVESADRQSESEAFYSALLAIMAGEVDGGGLPKGGFAPSNRKPIEADPTSMAAFASIERKHLVGAVKAWEPEPEPEPDPSHAERFALLKIERPGWARDMAEPRVYVWSAPKQDDLKRHPLNLCGDMLEARIDFCDYGFADGLYHMHAYALLDGVDTLISKQDVLMKFKRDDHGEENPSSEEGPYSADRQQGPGPEKPRQVEMAITFVDDVAG